MTKSIAVKNILKCCPICGSLLTFNTLASGIPTSCKCGFKEAPGSLYVMQYIANVVSEYMSLKGVSHLQGAKGDHYSLKKGYALSAIGYLPTLQRRNVSTVFGSASQAQVLSGSKLFGTINSSRAVTGERITLPLNSLSLDVIKHQIINQIIGLTNVVDETLERSKSLFERKNTTTFFMEDLHDIELHIKKGLPRSSLQESPHDSGFKQKTVGMTQ